jgi:hypothetical protein
MAAIKGKAPAQPVAGPSKPKVMNAAIPLTKAAEKVAIKDTVKKDDVTNESKTEDAPKATGKLDFSKARAKETKKVETTESKKIETKTKQKKKEIPPTKGTKSEKASLKPNADVVCYSLLSQLISLTTSNRTFLEGQKTQILNGNVGLRRWWRL